ncbi:YgfZ/GcvT domain-containing protein [Dietzia timorensis]|uniref:CAF17-like 4Fe-4S cluster assembly/insertion protein YgfZ n=1 Tax=Dietzia timorensis TaxID=499555 RepID=UPI001E3D06E8|nr:folate-binding protein [Dietzia timorensis]
MSTTGDASTPPAPSEIAPSLGHPGAVADPDGTTAGHFGDPFAEQRAAETGSALVDRSDREFVVLTGPERLTWLEGFISQHVTELAEGESTRSLILDANGRVEHSFGIYATADSLVLDTAAGRAQSLFEFLDKMVFWSEVTPRIASELALLTVVGPSAASVLDSLDDVAAPAPTDWLIARRARHGSAGHTGEDVIVDRAQLGRAWTALAEACSAVMGRWGFDALRVMELVPDETDLDEKTIPHEVPAWIGDVASGGAVHLDKGCYRGQETVSRVHNLGRAPRALVRLLLDGSEDELPGAGAEVKAGSRTVGRLGTAVHHHELGPVALALVKRNVGADVALTVSDGAASIDPDSLPDDSGPQAGRDAIKRLREG